MHPGFDKFEPYTIVHHPVHGKGRVIPCVRGWRTSFAIWTRVRFFRDGLWLFVVTEELKAL